MATPVNLLISSPKKVQENLLKLKEKSNTSSNEFHGQAEASQINDDELFIQAAESLKKSCIYGLSTSRSVGHPQFRPTPSPSNASSFNSQQQKDIMSLVERQMEEMLYNIMDQLQSKQNATRACAPSIIAPFAYSAKPAPLEQEDE